MERLAAGRGFILVVYVGNSLLEPAFSINHALLTYSVIASRNPVVWVYHFVVGLLMGVVYTKTHSLRWPVASYFLINLLSLSVALFLGLYDPGHLE